jgi:putative transposase
MPVMPRLARAIFPGVPHHVTQRGNGRARTFFTDKDYRLYLELLTEHVAAAAVDVLAFVLMPNHVHLILVPQDPDGLRRALAPVHRYYAGHVHKRAGLSGHFWQGRFGCVAMDETHLRAAVRYVALNPVRAHLCPRAEDWPWSSVHALLGRADGLTNSAAVLTRFPDMVELIRKGEERELSDLLRRAESIGRPLGSASFIKELEVASNRTLKPQRRGPKC